MLAEARFDRHRPRGMDAAAERREDDDPPVAELVAEALDEASGSVGSEPVAIRCSAR